MGKTFSTGLLTNAISTNGSNNVGIGGAADATAKLKVTGAATVTNGAIISGANYDAYVDATNANTLNFGYNTNATLDGWINYKGYAGGLTQFRNTNIGNGKGGAIATFVGSTGNVGIGTSSPNANLHIKATSGSAIFRIEDGGGNAVGRIQANAGDGSINFFEQSGYALTFGTSNTERIRITSGGVLMINTTSSVAGTPAQIEMKYAGSAVYGMNMRTTTVDGIPLSFVNSSGSQVGYIFTNASSTSYVTSSDYRLKQDLKDFNGLSLISSIKTYDYEWKADQTRAFGVLAHELQKVLPQAVTGEKDGKQMQGVDYSKIVPVLVRAVQELSTELNELKALIAAK